MNWSKSGGTSEVNSRPCKGEDLFSQETKGHEEYEDNGKNKRSRRQAIGKAGRNGTRGSKYEESQLYRMRHSAAHVMAQAVVEMFPEAKYTIGPPVENGFYYDFDLPRNLTPEDLEKIESACGRSSQGITPSRRR
jgi:threonyl-tRNA synthetase